MASGIHEFSEVFNSRFVNNSCWTLCFDFFIKYPELIGVIPICNPIPRSLSLDPAPQSATMVIEEDLGVCDWPLNESGFLEAGWMS
jgi:hypothetical protein